MLIKVRFHSGQRETLILPVSATVAEAMALIEAFGYGRVAAVEITLRR